MTYVIFHKDTTKYLHVFRNRYWQPANFYKTERAAKAALTRAGKKQDVSEYRILPSDLFAKIELTEVKHNLLNGKPFTQSVNTPASCDPSTETYHCM